MRRRGRVARGTDRRHQQSRCVRFSAANRRCRHRAPRGGCQRGDREINDSATRSVARADVISQIEIRHNPEFTPYGRRDPMVASRSGSATGGRDPITVAKNTRNAVEASNSPLSKTPRTARYAMIGAAWRRTLRRALVPPRRRASQTRPRNRPSSLNQGRDPAAVENLLVPPLTGHLDPLHREPPPNHSARACPRDQGCRPGDRPVAEGG